MSEPGSHRSPGLPPDELQRPRGSSLGNWLPWVAIAALGAGTAAVLHAEGRRWWCACGEPYLWVSDVWSSHNSQHLFDPYSFTHILHGLVFCGVLAWAAPRWPVP